MHFVTGKVVTCCVVLVGQHGATRLSRQARVAGHVFREIATAWTGVDMSTSLFLEVVPEIDANPELVTTRATRTTRHVMTRRACRDATSGIWAYPTKLEPENQRHRWPE